MRLENEKEEVNNNTTTIPYKGIRPYNHCLLKDIIAYKKNNCYRIACKKVLTVTYSFYTFSSPTVIMCLVPSQSNPL